MTHGAQEIKMPPKSPDASFREKQQKIYKDSWYYYILKIAYLCTFCSPGDLGLECCRPPSYNPSPILSTSWLQKSFAPAFFILFLVGLGFEFKVFHPSKTGTPLLEPHLQSILLWLFLEMESHELFAQAGLKP
jgi:hypothetical protein